MLGMAPPFGKAPKSRLRSGPSIYPSSQSALGESVAHRRLFLRCQAPGRLQRRRGHLCLGSVATVALLRGGSEPIGGGGRGVRPISPQALPCVLLSGLARYTTPSISLPG